MYWLLEFQVGSKTTAEALESAWRRQKNKDIVPMHTGLSGDPLSMDAVIAASEGEDPDSIIGMIPFLLRVQQQSRFILRS